MSMKKLFLSSVCALLIIVSSSVTVATAHEVPSGGNPIHN